MDKKKHDQFHSNDNQETVNESEIIQNENTADTLFDSMFILDEDSVQYDKEDESSFSIYENAASGEELNQLNERASADPREYKKNPYLDDEDFLDSELDIPGSELDDEMENIGSEDEENNYYSLGGDNHEDLEERDFEEDF